ncbi:MAG TPA: 1-deoxy-D-xylulose-5-phosphate reductoisomerase [Candidatus Binatia bacterium]|nr:1-deoxy-D-xylulose-5-phosphate reductoisomerase [Candidatus Binatia bacterium]
MSARALSVLGATGSVGRSTLDVVRRHPQRLRVHALTAQRDIAGLLALCVEFRPMWAALAEPAAARALAAALAAQGLPTQVLSGPEGIVQIAGDTQAELVMSAIVGAAGLVPTLAAVRAGRRVLVANKEPLVMAGALLMREAERAGAAIVPIDSEHNAIFQCLPAGFRCGHADPGVARLVLTASVGPFRDAPLDKLARVTPAEAVRHPNWSMGPKISVDSATMMNKGLELIEAQRLFGVPEPRIEVVLHPESVVHSLVEYVDGSMLAQLGAADMRVPIAHALAAPERWESGVRGLSLAEIGRLNFRPIEPARFPCLALARDALRSGGIFPNVLNAANEAAVDAFLGGRIGFTDIAAVIDRTLAAAAGAGLPGGDGLEDVLAVDAWARTAAVEAMSKRAVMHA